jgi:hypothetical protein
MMLSTRNPSQINSWNSCSLNYQHHISATLHPNNQNLRQHRRRTWPITFEATPQTVRTFNWKSTTTTKNITQGNIKGSNCPSV